MKHRKVNTLLVLPSFLLWVRYPISTSDTFIDNDRKSWLESVKGTSAVKSLSRY